VKFVAAALLLTVLAAPALGATSGSAPSSAVDDVLKLDGASAQPPTGPDAMAISNDIFNRSDAAYGAFQRGYYLTALALALPRAEKADPAAQTLIAEIYAKGLGVAENVASASSWYGLAAKNGDRVAAFELGLLYLSGDGVPKNQQRAAELFKQASDKGYPPAEYNLALLHIEGQNASPSLNDAASLMKAAADSGLAEAQYDYGSMLIAGAGVPPDAKEGARQVGLAAEQGLVEAEIDYATLLYLGQGIDKNLHEAVGWYQRAASAGNPVGQNRYAKLLAVGEGVDLDLKQAAMWRALARRQGMTDPVLDKLLIGISQKDLDAAEELARFWPSRPPNADDVKKAEDTAKLVPSTKLAGGDAVTP
jgi:TPR repeat protein